MDVGGNHTSALGFKGSGSSYLLLEQVSNIGLTRSASWVSLAMLRLTHGLVIITGAY